jgi:acyl-coenzyme A thioesterase PaaI-like protein
VSTTDTRTRFSAVSAVAAAGSGRFEANVDPEWTIGGKPNGGYLLAMLGQAASAISPHPHVISASAYYLHAPQPGAVTIEAELLREGRSASQARARMSQDGAACVEATLITSRWSRARLRTGTAVSRSPAGPPSRTARGWSRGCRPEPGWRSWTRSRFG